jgi:hypothetical protein
MKLENEIGEFRDANISVSMSEKQRRHTLPAIILSIPDNSVADNSMPQFDRLTKATLSITAG